MSTPKWFADVTSNGVVFARIGADGDRLLAEWRGVGRLAVDRNGANSSFTSEADANPIQRAKVEHGIAQLLLRSLEGKIGLHAAAVGMRDRAAVFLGNAGSGKSTLAAACSCELGAALLGDDAVALEHRSSSWTVVPSEDAHFLDGASALALGYQPGADAIGSKFRIRSRLAGREEVRLVGLVAPVFDDTVSAPSLRRLDVVNALAVLIPQTIRFAIDESARHRRELEQLTELASEVPSFELRRPRRFDALRETLDLLGSTFFEAES